MASTKEVVYRLGVGNCVDNTTVYYVVRALRRAGRSVEVDVVDAPSAEPGNRQIVISAVVPVPKTVAKIIADAKR